MFLSSQGKAKSFEELEPGSIFDTIISGTTGPHLIRAVKAFSKNSSGHEHRLVTLGPFMAYDENVPGVYDPTVLNKRPVLDVTDSWSFSPSLELSDITVQDSALNDEQFGLVFISDKYPLMICARMFGWGNWNAREKHDKCYVNLVSGEILSHIDQSSSIITRKWSWLARVEFQPV